MSHPTPEQLKPLVQAVDTAVWALAVKKNTRKGSRCKVDWRGALDELESAYADYSAATSDLRAVLSEVNQTADTGGKNG